MHDTSERLRLQPEGADLYLATLHRRSQVGTSCAAWASRRDMASRAPTFRQARGEGAIHPHLLGGLSMEP
jgi:hypothetical protein